MKALSIAILVALPTPLFAADFHVDPARGSPANDGSAELPWATLEGVVEDGKLGAEIRAGDTVWLYDGYHGDVVVNGGDFTPPIRISAAPSTSPRLRRIAFEGARGFNVSGLEISPSFAATYEKVTSISVDGASSAIIVERCVAYSVADASAWSAGDWIDVAANGADVRGAGVTIAGCRFRNVRFGISVSGPDARILSNVIDGFSADGLRGLGDRGLFEDNTVKNIYVGDGDGDSNHDDGFQSWSVGPNGVGTGEVTGVVLRGNTFISTEDPLRPFQASMQGIGCFDGFFRDWVVENNVVITDHWHGISLYGMRGGRIVNNTVIDVNVERPGPPWIMVTDHKDGTPSEDVVVRNNISTDLDVSGSSVTADHNSEISMDELDTWFVDAPGFDLRLTASSPGVDTGEAELAPSTDRAGTIRPQGSAVDRGAFEWFAPTPDGGLAPNLSLEPPNPDDASTPSGSDAETVDSGSGVPDASAPLPSADAGDPADLSSDGCGCESAHESPAPMFPALLVAVVFLGRRIRRRSA